MNSKRQHGQFYTVENPFAHSAFKQWAKQSGLPNARLLEPFAGCGSLLDHLQAMKLCNEYRAYDIAPAGAGITTRDTLTNFPKGFDVCITNPPWLARNSATLRGIPFPDSPFDDLYKVSLAQCLSNCNYVAALVPESFIRSGLLRERLSCFISLTEKIFHDTDFPVGLAMFTPFTNKNIPIYSANQLIGNLVEIEEQKPKIDPAYPIKFNDKNGNLGLIAVDNSRYASIRFCDPRELANYEIGNSSRYITRLSVAGSICVEKLNQRLEQFRNDTCDVLMTPYRGLRKDGKYRRRLDWGLARGIICNV